METLRITIRKEASKGFNLFTSHKWLKDKKEIVFEFDEWGVSLRIAGIDDIDIINIHPNGLNGHTFQIYNKDINQGVLVFDESESTEDKIYFNYL